MVEVTGGAVGQGGSCHLEPPPQCFSFQGSGQGSSAVPRSVSSRWNEGTFKEEKRSE